MIKLTTLQNKEIVLNADLIERLEKVPETLITLTNGKKIIVAENLETVIEKVVAYKRRILYTAGVAEKEVD